MVLSLPEAGGVPGLDGQPPTWPGVDALNGHPPWDAARSASTPRGLDDPRWAGHVAIGWPSISTAPVSCCGGAVDVDPGFGAATTEDVAFRALYDQTAAGRFLYLSWWVKADDLNSLLDDRLTVGFTRAAGEALILRITPSTSPASTTAAPVGPVLVHTAAAAGGAVHQWVENGGAPPSWIAQNTHVWIDSVSHRWAVQMRVPLGSGNVDTHVDLLDPFKMWFEVAVELPGDLLAPYSWPRNACVSSSCGFPPRLNVPPTAAWGDFGLGAGGGAAGYVQLSVGDIGTQNTPTHQINLTSPNVFEAKPENKTGGVVAAGEVNAEFWIADWGSQADPTPWIKIPATGGTTNPAVGQTAIADGAKGSLTMSWQLSATERNKFVPTGTKPRHQCMLVTLTGAHVFNPASAWRNMEFVNASRFERPATISNEGLGQSPSPGLPRPAYILVERLSMPPVVERPRDPRGREKDTDRIPTHRAAVDEVPPVELLAAALAEHGDPVDRLEQAPTIRYHVYHDTGVNVTVDDGRTLRVVRSGTVFGFHVAHDGPLKGWSEEVQGATKVTDRFYRLDVPEEGTAKITTVIEAVEPMGCLYLWAVLKRFIKKIVGGP